MKKRSKWYISKTTKIKLNISNETIKGEISNYDVKFVTAKKPTKVLAQSLKPILFQLEISSISRLRIPQQAKEKSIRK